MFIRIYGPHAYALLISNVETRLKWLLTSILLLKFKTQGTMVILCIIYRETIATGKLSLPVCNAILT